MNNPTDMIEWRPALHNAQVVVPLAHLIEELERTMTHKPNDYAQEGANYAIGRIIRVLRGLT